MTPVHQLYFIAIIPPPPLTAEIRLIQEDFSVRFLSKKALNVVPHITLLPPFRLRNEEIQRLHHWFETSRVDLDPFDLSLDGFAAFNNKKQPVVYLKPVVNDQLGQLHQQLFDAFHASFPGLLPIGNLRPFTPHLTIAYRDLTKAMFDQAWGEYRSRNYQATFTVDRYHLLKHSGKQWDPIASVAI